jgi:sigma-B regulation protein RsbU (phosphoserine phosphatase)
MNTLPSSIKVIGSNQQVLDSIAELLEGVQYELISTGEFTERDFFKFFGVYIIQVESSDDMALLTRLSESPGYISTLALSYSSESAQVFRLLRAGADDVFVVDSLSIESEAFNAAVLQSLKRCQLMYDGQVYREGLERTLEELKEDQLAAYSVQKRLLPPTSQTVSGLQIEYSLKPSLIVSGDFVDVIPVSDELTMFYLADVSGHGASSALVTILLKNLTSRLQRNFKRASSYDLLSPLKTLDRINSEVHSLGLDKHLTIFCGLVDHLKNTLAYAVGGHHPMPIYHSGAKTYMLPGRGMPAGLFTEALFEQNEIELDDEFTLSLFSDGVMELLPQKTIKEKEQALVDWIAIHGASFNRLSAFIYPHHDADDQPQYPDDITIMSVSRVKT